MSSQVETRLPETAALAIEALLPELEATMLYAAAAWLGHESEAAA